MKKHNFLTAQLRHFLFKHNPEDIYEKGPYAIQKAINRFSKLHGYPDELEGVDGLRNNGYRTYYACNGIAFTKVGKVYFFLN